MSSFARSLCPGALALLVACATGGNNAPSETYDAAVTRLEDADVDDPIDARKAIDARKSIDADDGDEADAEVDDPVDAAVDAAVPRADAGPLGGLGPWTGHDHVKASPNPPFGLSPSEVPQFVVLGFDDNGHSAGVQWVLDLAKTRTNKDGSPVKFSFYLTSWYVSMWISESPTFVKRLWHRILTDAHEWGNHTQAHATSETTPAATWQSEIDTCDSWMSKPFDAAEDTGNPSASNGAGLAVSGAYGFRAPFLAYNADSLDVVNAKSHFWYDCSIEEGYEDAADGTNFVWPYTLDEGSPGHEAQLKWPDTTKLPIRNEPGLWEMPAYVVIVPPDNKCVQYGVPSGLRARLKTRVSWFDDVDGKFTGFDYNLWAPRGTSGLEMTKAEFLATLKYTLDLRLNGNRAPFLLGVHSDYYADSWTDSPGATPAERRAALTEFVDYARSKTVVRVVSAKQTLDWIRNPTRL